MIAIHHRSNSFSEKWIDYCEQYNVNYKLVNCFDSDIIAQLEDCEGLMWHWPHSSLKAKLFVRQLIASLEKMGKKVFPNLKSCWHYDDKVGQKYLLEAVDAPLIPSYVFYNKEKALKWMEKTSVPKVFKTRNGAGSENVRLVRSKREGKKIINTAFSKGVSSYSKYSKLKESIWLFKRDRTFRSIGRVIKFLLKLPLPSFFQGERSLEKNYVYFQDFIPDCKCDYRMKVIGNRCWGFRRFTRDNDFRASGSGLMDFNQEKIPIELIELSLDLTKKLDLQCVAYDFVQYKKKFLLIEISYASSMTKGQAEQGYWDSDLNWHEGKFIPEYFMIEDFINELQKNRVKY